MSPSPLQHISVVGAFAEGWRRVIRAPAVVLGLFAVSIVLELALSSAGSGLETHFLNGGRSVDGQTLTFAVIALGGPLATVSASIDQRVVSPLRAAPAIANLVVWLFLWGGALDRLARARRIGSSAFFAACGGYLGRLTRLALPFGLAYMVAARLAHPPTYLSALAIAALNIVAEFAWTRTIVEDRRSALGAIMASFRFIRRRLIPVLGVYALNVAAMGLLAVFWSALAVSPSMPFWPLMLTALVIPLIVRLALAAGNITLFQRALAHAEYTSAPLPIWPESPAAEAIENLVGQRTQRRDR